MDQDNTKSQDKRNWRERLGIGAQGNKDLPKISDDFKKEAAPGGVRPVPVAAARSAPPRPAAPAVKPAPMAPRANPKAINPASPVPPDRLAERLRSQREASTKLAEQRVQVARQKAEAQVVAPTPPSNNQAAAPGAPKPKFTFAEENQQGKAATPPSAPPPVVAKPQITPPRAPLGGAPVVPPAVTPPNTPRPAPAYVPQQGGYVPQSTSAFQPQYSPQPVPPYRPIDPATGMPSAGGYVPPRNFTVPPPQQQPGFQGGPRLNVPPRVPVAPTGGYNVPGDYSATGRMARPDPRVAPAPNREYETEFYDELPPVRGGRPTSTDYQQAYREAEYGYEEEAPRSKAPWILAGLLLLALLVAGGGVWFYQNSIKPIISGQSGTQDVPAVAAPEAPAKVQPEQPAAAAQQPAAASPTKKQIYDRIVGDQEVLGGEVTPPAEQPAAIPEPATTGETPSQPVPAGSGEDAAPLPIPPPPGGAGDQQGSLAPENGKQSSEVVTSAAGESQAAVAAQDLPLPPRPAAEIAAQTPPGPPAQSAVVQTPSPPAPGEIDKARSILSETKAPDPVESEPEDNSQRIVETPTPAPVKKAAAPVKKTAEKTTGKKLGAKPVVLVPPGKKTRAPAKQIAAKASQGDDVENGGLYGNEELVVVPALPANQEAVAAPPKKKKTLADLFNNNQDETSDATVEAPASPTPAPKKVAAVEPPPAVAKPVEPAVSSGNGFMVQLASFRSRDEASREFSRLKAKHGGALGPYSPIITEAQVGGSTRYRLSAGRMNSQAQASAVCSSLFAKGERDCIVKKQ